MKKLFVTLLIMFLIYLGIQVCFKIFGKEYITQYKINSIDIEETYVNDSKDYYNFEIKTDKNTFLLSTYQNFNKESKIIKDIKIFNNNQYECILPIFKDNKIIMDIQCISNNVIKNYQTIKGIAELDKFANEIEGYKDKFTKKEDITITKDTLNIYVNNIVDNHFLGLTSYKGLYTINNNNVKKVYDTEIFAQDVYKRPLSTFYNEYYIVADYDQKFNFESMHIINLKNTKDSKINSKYSISFDSFVQGVVDDQVYIIDTNSKMQYKVDINNKQVENITNGTKVTHYENGTFKELEINNVIKNKTKFKSSYENNVFAKYQNYSYISKSVNNGYAVYRTIDNQQLTYLFTTKDINDVIVVNDYIYYRDDNKIKYYNDSTGIKTIIENSEFKFNNDIKYHVYGK